MTKYKLPKTRSIVKAGTVKLKNEKEDTTNDKKGINTKDGDVRNAYRKEITKEEAKQKETNKKTKEVNAKHKEELKNAEEIKYDEPLNDKKEVLVNINTKEQLNSDILCINKKAIKKLHTPAEKEIQPASFVGNEEATLGLQSSINNSIMKAAKSFSSSQRARSKRANSVSTLITSLRKKSDKKVTNQLVAKQFIKEYKNILKRLRITSNYLNPQEIRNILLEEGFLSWSNKLLIECEVLEEEILNTLSKDELGVPTNDLMVFLAAIMNIDISQSKKLDKRTLELAETDIRQIHKKFYDYYNRKKSNTYVKKNTLRECTFPSRLLRSIITPRNLKELSYDQPDHQKKE